MSTEVEHVAPDVVHPVTGECITLATATEDQLARFLSEVREFEGLLRDAKSLVNRETLRRMDAAVKAGTASGWTQRIGDYILKAPSSEPSTEYDAKGLHDDLLELVEREVIGSDAVPRVIDASVVYKVNRSGLKSLAKACPEVAEAAQNRLSEVEKARYVRVERA